MKSEIKNRTKVTLNLSLNVVGDSYDENNFAHKLLLTNKQSKIHISEAFPNNSSANIKLSKTQLHNIVQSGGSLGRLLRPFLKNGLSLTENVLKTLAKSVLRLLGLTAVALTTVAVIHKKKSRSGFITLIISNEEMNDIVKIVNSLEESGVIIKGVSKTIKNEAIEQKGGFLGMLLRSLGVSLLGNLITGKGTIRAGGGTIRAGENF